MDLGSGYQDQAGSTKDQVENPIQKKNWRASLAYLPLFASFVSAFPPNHAYIISCVFTTTMSKFLSRIRRRWKRFPISRVYTALGITFVLVVCWSYMKATPMGPARKATPMGPAREELCGVKMAHLVSLKNVSWYHDGSIVPSAGAEMADMYDVLLRHEREGAYLDVGANAGVGSWYPLLLGAKRVYSFEAASPNIAYLVRACMRACVCVCTCDYATTYTCLSSQVNMA